MITNPPDTNASSNLRLTVGFRSDVGRARDRNEDAYAVWIPLGEDRGSACVDACLVVSDGMGGHEAGEVASRTAADAAREAFAGPHAPQLAYGDELLGWLEQLVRFVNSRLIELGQERRLKRGMGCTLTIATIFDGHLYLAHVGDSRCYRLRNDELTQLTQDHSWVAEQRRAGLLTAEEERNHPQRNVLIRCLGADRELQVDLSVEPIEPGDHYLLCSDGLHGLVEDMAIAEAICEAPHPQAAVERLVELANSAGGPDNVTAVLLEVSDERAPLPVVSDPTETLTDTQPLPALATPRRFLRRWVVAFGAATVILGAGTGAWSMRDAKRASAPSVAQEAGIADSAAGRGSALQLEPHTTSRSPPEPAANPDTIGVPPSKPERIHD